MFLSPSFLTHCPAPIAAPQPPLPPQVFLAYLNAALLEPVLAIAGMEAAEGPQLLINTLTLISIFWWIWLVTDAFDWADGEADGALMRFTDG